MAKEFIYHGKGIEELSKMSVKEFAELVPSRQRKSLLKGFTDEQKIFLEKLKADKPNLRTHCRNMIILPLMVGKNVKVHNGHNFVPVRITIEMLGHYLGEFALTRKKVEHHAPGIGATRSSASLSVK
nr:30S ribosomal protein S19, small subunit ribosomal protein S19 [uncultured archaeon]